MLAGQQPPHGVDQTTPVTLDLVAQVSIAASSHAQQRRLKLVEGLCPRLHLGDVPAVGAGQLTPPQRRHQPGPQQAGLTAAARSDDRQKPSVAVRLAQPFEQPGDQALSPEEVLLVGGGEGEQPLVGIGGCRQAARHRPVGEELRRELVDDELQLSHLHDELHPAAHVQLLVDLVDMPLDRAQLDGQRLRDLAVRLARDNQLGDLLLAEGQPLDDLPLRRAAIQPGCFAKILGEGDGVAISPGRVFGRRPLQHPVNGIADSAVQRGELWQRRLKVLEEPLSRFHAWIGVPACQHLVQHDAQAVDVALRRQHVSACLLGRDVTRRAEQVQRLDAGAAGCQFLRDAEVREVGVAVLVQEDVGRF